LPRKNGCTACHAIGKKVVGPDWAEVAKKYKGDAGAKAKLVPKMIKCGGGAYGGAMPYAQQARSSREAEFCARWLSFILGLAK